MLKRFPSPALQLAIATLLSFAFLTGCGREKPTEPSSPSPSAATEDAGAEADLPGYTSVVVWMHAGPMEERNVVREYIHNFNTHQDEVRVDLIVIAPEEAYSEELQKAALDGVLPDIVQINAPDLYRHIFLEHLAPLGDLLSADLAQDLLPSVTSQGTYNGELYSVALSDAAIGLYLNPAKLYGINFRLPRSVRTAWSAEEFDQLLKLAFEENGGKPVLDLKLNYEGDWLAHIFTPLLVSSGAGLWNPESGTATGTVNSEEAIRTMSLIQSWFQNGYVDPNDDDEAFTSGRVAFSWSGHWDFLRYDRALEGTFGVVPVPNFGEGSRTAHGGWSWAISRDSNNPAAAAQFLEFMLQSDNIVELTETTGAVPSRRDAIGRSSHYGAHLKLETFARQLEEGFATRPKTPASAAMMSAFQRSIKEIIAGAEVRPTLDQLAEQIDRHIAEKSL